MIDWIDIELFLCDPISNKNIYKVTNQETIRFN